MFTPRPKLLIQAVSQFEIYLLSRFAFNFDFILLGNLTDGFAMLSTDGDSGAQTDDNEQYDQSEFLYIKLGQGKNYDLKVEHFDDMIQDNSF